MPGGGRFALLLGNERFDHARAETGFTELSGPGHDVTGLATLLADPEIGAFSVVTSIDTAADELRRGIESFLSARRPNDLVLLYYSGHGLRSREGDGLYLAARDTDEHLLLSTSLDTEWLHKVLKKCPARSQVVILDCCHAAAYPGAKGTPDLELGALATAMDGRGRYVLAAARPGQAAYDARHADDPAELGSHYTNVVCEGLRTGAAAAAIRQSDLGPLRVLVGGRRCCRVYRIREQRDRAFQPRPSTNHERGGFLGLPSPPVRVVPRRLEIGLRHPSRRHSGVGRRKSAA